MERRRSSLSQCQCFWSVSGAHKTALKRPVEALTTLFLQMRHYKIQPCWILVMRLMGTLCVKPATLTPRII